MKRLLVGLTVCFSLIAACAAWAEDLGKIGPTFPIAERDLIQVFMARAQARVDDGSWAKIMQTQQDKMKAYAERPTGRQLPRALTYQVQFFDPTVTLGDDILDQDGKVIWPKGTKVNPLNYRSYPRALCFFDGDDAAQVQWAKERCLQGDKIRAILVNGPVLQLSKQFNAMVYFDQYGYISKRFGLVAVPALVRQSQNQFAIEYFPVSQ